MNGEISQSKRIELEVKKLGIFELRGLAREVGVPSPTTKKREELIDSILERISKGKLDEVVITKKGRPFKKLAVVDNILNAVATNDKFATQTKMVSFEDILSFAQVMPVMGGVTNQTGSFKGVVRQNDNSDILMFYDFDSAQAIFLPNELEFVSLLSNGDMVQCKAKKINNNQFFATQITLVNGEKPDQYSPKCVDLGEQIISNANLNFADKKVFVGRRNLLVVKENFYENQNFDMLSAQAIEEGYKIVYLSLNSSVEDQIKLRTCQGLVLDTKFDDPCMQSLNKALDCIGLCENLLSRGEKVLLIIPDIINVVRALDYCFIDQAKMYGHSMQSIVVAQKIMSLGKAFKQGANVTVLLCCDENDVEDEFVTNQLVKICKMI